MADDFGIEDRNGVISGSPGTVCGILGDGLAFDGQNDFIRFPDNFSTLFSQNFTLSFYFRPDGGTGEQQLFSYTDACNDPVEFEITYAPQTSRLVVEYGEDDINRILLEATLDPNRCWYHVVLIRDGRRQSLRVDNEVVDEAANLIRIDFNNPGTFSIADGPCVGSFYNRFEGAIDEVRIYNEVLGTLDLQDLYFAPESILTPDTLLYLGGEAMMRVSPGCSNQFSWSPTAGLSNPNIANPIARPDTTTTYRLQFESPTCVTTDEVEILVVDPDQVGCDELAMANGFTPNSDGINDEFGIANPFVVDELENFRIFDQSGGLMFESQNPFAVWDGSYEGKLVNPGTYLYQIIYTCEGVEKVQQGTVVLLR
jgi:gliding motility-associated-like protein